MKVCHQRLMCYSSSWLMILKIGNSAWQTSHSHMLGIIIVYLLYNTLLTRLLQVNLIILVICLSQVWSKWWTVMNTDGQEINTDVHKKKCNSGLWFCAHPIIFARSLTSIYIYMLLTFVDFFCFVLKLVFVIVIVLLDCYIYFVLIYNDWKMYICS